MAALSPSNPPCIFKVYANFSAAGILSVQRTSGSNNITEYLYGNQQLSANVPYTFYVAVDSGETIDFEYSASCTINKFTVTELDMATTHQTDTPIHAIGADYVGLFKAGQNIGTFSQSPITVETDNVGLTKASQLPGSLTGSGNFKISHEEDPNGFFTQIKNMALDASNFIKMNLQTDGVGLAKQSQLPSALSSNGNLKLAIAEQLLTQLTTDVGTSNSYAKDASLKPIAKGNIVKSSYTANASIF